MNRSGSFDRKALRQLLEREGLLAQRESSSAPKLPAIGVRGFMRFAEYLEADVAELVCYVDNFSGRHPKEERSWSQSAESVTKFLGDATRRARVRCEPHAIHLDCHGSTAFLAGYELSRNSGAQVFPVQKPRLEVWRPTASSADIKDVWDSRVIQLGGTSEEVAIALSVTHTLANDVEQYLRRAQGQVSKLVILSPKTGVGFASVSGADHAYSLAAEFLKHTAEHRVTRSSRLHLFFACPNALLFFIGQLREGLGRLSLYEFDFGMQRDGSYSPSLSFP